MRHCLPWIARRRTVAIRSPTPRTLPTSSVDCICSPIPVEPVRAAHTRATSSIGLPASAAPACCCCAQLPRIWSNTPLVGTEFWLRPSRAPREGLKGRVNAPNHAKLARATLCRKSLPRISTTTHISCSRESMRSPIRSPSVSSRIARFAGDSCAWAADVISPAALA
jgi:hypothetical protein